MTPFRLVACFLAAVLTGALLTGCDHDDQARGSVSSASADTTPVTVPTVSLPPESAPGDAAPELSPLPSVSGDRLDADLEAEIALVDPSSDGWGTEVLAEQILGELKAFAAWAEAGKKGPCPLALSGGFRGPVLGIEGTAPTIDVDPYRVWRGTLARNVTAADWLEVWPVAVPSHFKVIQISAREAGGAVRATILVDRSAQEGGERESLQENAVWITEWQTGTGQGLELDSIAVPFYERIEPASPDTFVKPLFADATGTVLGPDPAHANQFAHGIDHWRDRIDWRFGIEVTGPHGLAIGDANGDGLEDVYICETGGLPNRLYLQQADGTAIDAAASAGLDFLEPTQSALWVDWDNDGDQDIALTVGRYVFFYANDGNARFEQKAVAASGAMARSLAAADYDQDGDADLYVCGYFNRSGDTVGLGRPMPYHDANNGAENHLLANVGGWKFENVTESVGLNENNRRFSYAAAWDDADNDGDLDLYVANDFGRNNLYRNEGGRFTDVAAESGVEDISAGMSVSWGDYDQDGFMDLYVGNMFSSAGNRIAYQRQYRAGMDAGAQHALRRHARGNTLFRNRGDGTFQDVTLQAGVNMGRWAWSSNFADINNDSFEDLLIANGMVTSVDDTGDL